MSRCRKAVTASSPGCRRVVHHSDRAGDYRRSKYADIARGDLDAGLAGYQPAVRDSASWPTTLPREASCYLAGQTGGSDLNDTLDLQRGDLDASLPLDQSPRSRHTPSIAAYDPAYGEDRPLRGSGNSGDRSVTRGLSTVRTGQISTTRSPPARDSASFAYDRHGRSSSSGEGNVQLGDTDFRRYATGRSSPRREPAARWYSPPWPTTQPPQTWSCRRIRNVETQRHVDLRRYDLGQSSPPPRARLPATAHRLPTTRPRVTSSCRRGGSSGDLSDTWTFDGTNWTQVTTASSPTARDGATMAYDLATSGVVLFGGEADSVSLSDTWTFAQITVVLSQASPTAATVAYGAGYGGHLAVTNAAGTVSYIEARTDATDVIVSGSGAIRAATSLAPGTYTVTGRDSDTNGDIGSWTFSLTVGKASQTVVFHPQLHLPTRRWAPLRSEGHGRCLGNEVTFSTTSICTCRDLR